MFCCALSKIPLFTFLESGRKGAGLGRKASVAAPSAIQESGDGDGEVGRDRRGGRGSWTGAGLGNGLHLESKEWGEGSGEGPERPPGHPSLSSFALSFSSKLPSQEKRERACETVALLSQGQKLVI